VRVLSQLASKLVRACKLYMTMHFRLFEPCIDGSVACLSLPYIPQAGR
jgi:hypothetical protein